MLEERGLVDKIGDGYVLSGEFYRLFNRSHTGHPLDSLETATTMVEIIVYKGEASIPDIELMGMCLHSLPVDRQKYATAIADG